MRTKRDLAIRDAIQEMWNDHIEYSHWTWEDPDKSEGYVYGVERTIERFAEKFGLELNYETDKWDWKKPE